MTNKSKRRVRFTRDGVLFMSGLVGVAYETYTGQDRATLLLLFAAMMGLPAFIQKDEQKKDGDEGGPPRR